MATRRRSCSLENDPEVAKRDLPARRTRPVSLVRTMSGSVDNQLAGQIFDHFCGASTLKSILRSFRYLCDVIRLKPNQLPYFYPKLKANLLSWKAQALWAKLDKRASQKCYNRGKACAGTRVLIIGAGPCGLRTAIEAQLLGAKVVVVEKRDRYSRNNVLHLWPYNIQDLRALGAKKFYGKFCAGSIDHISIRQLQCILLKVSLLLGVEVFEGVGFESLVEPTDQDTGWRARVEPVEHPVSQYEFDVLIGADGKRNTLAGFKRKEFRGKLAIAITANFINKHSEAEGRVEEISGVAFIFNQKFFNDLNAACGISLENIVYYKDETHYFVMTAKKQSLLAKGVLVANHADPSALLAQNNICQEALFQYAREAADFATKGQLPHLDFAVNHYGKPDVAMFDFTSMYAADHSARVTERHGHRLLQCLVGDSLLEPFWPTGTGCPRGFFSAMDAMWLMKQMDSGKMSILECLAERESINRILSQTTPENTCKNFNLVSIDPSTRYPTLNLKLVLPFQVTHLVDTDNPSHLQPQNVLQDSAPRKKRRKDSHVSPTNLLSWIQKQVEPYNIQVLEMNTCFRNDLVLCAIINRYRPDLLPWESLDPECAEDNLQLGFDILEAELGLQPVITASEIMENSGTLDPLAVISYLTGVYELFRREIPHTQQTGGVQLDDLDDSVYCHNHRERVGREERRRLPEESITIGQLVANDARRGKRGSLEELDEEEGKGLKGDGRRVSNKKRLAKLMERSAVQERKRNDEMKKLEPSDIRREENFRKIQEMMAGERRREEGKQRDKKPMDLGRAIGRLDSEDWAIKQIEEKLKETKRKEKEGRKEKVPKWSKEAFNDKLKKVKCTLENGTDLRKKYDKESSLSRLKRSLKEGSNLETGERGSNKVSALVGELASKLDNNKERPELKRETSNVWQPPKNKSSRTSDNCHFCQQKVYVVERMSAEGKFFHRACFRCDYCSILLRLGSYVYHREGRFATKFFCIPHSTENALEKYKYKKKADEIKAGKDKRQVVGELKNEQKPLSPIRRERILDIDRGGTPERAEFEASLNPAEEEGRIMDEDEWTDLNFGNSTNCANTSEDSVSDLDSDTDLQNGLERPLTANESRELAREWRARQGVTGVEEVNYTDQEYEDSSDCEGLPVEVPKVNRYRRRGPRRVTASSEEGSTDDTESISDSSDSADEEIREIERRDNNPFNTMSIPKIIVEPNSPLVYRKDPPAKYIHQAVPLTGPTPPGTALYKPSLTSLSKYQYKTPDYTKPQPQGPLYRTTNGGVSNNLKKSWVSAPTNQSQTQKKVDQSEIDARLRSLMDRLSNQQSLLKPADKPSKEMQHYLDNAPSTHRKLSDSTPYIPYKPATRITTSPAAPVITNIVDTDKQESGNSTGDTVHEEPVLESAPSDELDENLLDSSSESTETDSDSDTDTDTSQASDIEIEKKFDEVPEITINLVDGDTDSNITPIPATPQPTTPQPATSKPATPQPATSPSVTPQPTTSPATPQPSTNVETTISEASATENPDLCEEELGDKSADKDDQSSSSQPTPANVDEIRAPGSTSEVPTEDCDTAPCDTQPEEPSPDTHENSTLGEAEDRNQNDSKPELTQDRARIPPIRRPSLLKTVVSIKNSEPVTVVNYEMVDTFDSIDFIDDGSSCGESPDKNKQFAVETVKDEDAEIKARDETTEISESISETRNGGEETQNGAKEIHKGGEENKNGGLLIVSHHADPLFDGENETSTDPAANPVNPSKTEDEQTEPADLHQDEINQPSESASTPTSAPPEADTEVWDILKSKNSSEKKARLNIYQQKQSNIVHNLIMGMPRQRRVRQPRALAPTSSIKPPPSDQIAAESSPRSPVSDSDESFSVSFNPSAYKSGDFPRNIRESSLPRSIRDSSPRITAAVSLPPTPITNPEKFGIKKQDGRQVSEGLTSPARSSSSQYLIRRGISGDLISPTGSHTSYDTDNLDGLVSSAASSLGNSPKKAGANSNSNTPKKGRGFMAAMSSMTNIFRGSSSPQPCPQKAGGHQPPLAGQEEDEDEVLSRSVSVQKSKPGVTSVLLGATLESNHASLHSFTEQDEVGVGLSEENLKKLTDSQIPPHLLERLEKRLTSKGQVQANRASMQRVRRIQEIQRELGVVEVECLDIEREGVVLEKKMSGAEKEKDEEKEVELLAAWYRLLGEKNRLVRREQELMVESKQLELIELADRAEIELIRVDGEEATALLDKISRIAEQREELEQVLDKDRERYRREDREIQLRMQQQGISATMI